MRDSIKLLRFLGIRPRYKGYYYLKDAMQICDKMLEEPIMITKDIYPVLAAKYKCKIGTIEQAIRFSIRHSWAYHREKMEMIAEHELQRYPTNKDFLDMMMYYLKNNKANPL